MEKIGTLYGVDIWQYPTFRRDINGHFEKVIIDYEQIEFLHTEMLNLIRKMDCLNIKLVSIEVR